MSKSIKVKATNLETDLSTEYLSIKEATKSLNTSKTAIIKYILKSKLFKGVYKLESNLSESNYDSNYLNHPNSIKIEVIDVESNTLVSYNSICAAARALDIKSFSIGTYLKRNQKKSF